MFLNHPIRSEPTIQYGYDPHNSFGASRPPLENGWYGVLLDDGLMTSAYWRDGRWLLGDASALGCTVQRYSGCSVQVDAVDWPMLLDSIRAAWSSVDDEARQVVRKAALSLARHCAWRREQAENARTEAVAIFYLCWYYRVALAYGETLMGGMADAAIFNFYWDALDSMQRAAINRQLLLPGYAWPSADGA